MDYADPFAWRGVRRAWEFAKPIIEGLAFLALMVGFCALCIVCSDYNWN